MSISCGTARRILWPDGGPRPATPEVIQAQEHAAGCADCQRFLLDMRTLGDRIRELAPRPEAPAAVRNRIFRTLAHARTGRRPTPRWMAVAPWTIAAAAVLVIGGLWLTRVGARRGDARDVLTVMAEDHARALADAGIRSSDPAVVTRWLAARLPFAIHVPDLPDAELRGARLCLMEGQRGAVVEYRVGEQTMSYFVLPELDRVDGAASVGELQHASRAGYRVVAWREPGLVHALVGSVPAAELARLARICIEQAREAMSELGGRLLMAGERAARGI